MKNEVGFSTGTLHGKDISLEEKISILSGKNISTLELSFGTLDEFLYSDLASVKDQLLSTFSSISLHAPWKGIQYTDDALTSKVLKKLEDWQKDINFSGIVVHPDIVLDFGVLDSSGLPFCIENMDRRKTFGTHPEHFHEIIQKYNFGFVLDVEHAYERDQEMNLAKELIFLFGSRLKHMHVSGCSKDQLHVPTYLSENREAIEKILMMNIGVPKISEGVIDSDYQNIVEEESTYLGSF